MPVTPLISVIDDDESVRMATTALARSLGHAVRSFASAQAFLELAYVDNTSCLIVDVQMPRISGVELQSTLLSQGRRIPIIFMTAFPDEKISITGPSLRSSRLYQQALPRSGAH